MSIIKPNKTNIAISFTSVTKNFSRNNQKTFKEFLPALFYGEKTVDKFTVFSDVSFEIKRGECVGIIGPNGSGKSTILKLIAGVMSPSKGKVHVRGKVSPLIELGAGMHPELTGRENVYLNGAILGLSRRQIDDNFQSILDFSELSEFIDQPIKHYSSGMYMRLAFSIAIHVNPEILIVDEILAVGADFVGGSEGQEDVGDAAAEAELRAELLVDQSVVAAIDVIDDGAGGKLREGVEVGVPFAFGVEERLIALGPDGLDDGLESGPVDGVEVLVRDEGDAAAMHPDGDGDLLGRIERRQRDVTQMRHERAAGGLHFLRALHEVEGQPEVAAELIGQHVHGRFQHAADGRDGAGLVLHALDLAAEGVEVVGHGPGALHERNVAAVGPAGLLAGDTGQPGAVEEADGILDEFVVLFTEHPGLVLGGLTILEGDVGLDVNAGDGVVAQV